MDPATAGSNQIHLYLTDRSGQPTNVDEATVAATLASRGIGPLRLTAHRAGPGHFVVHGAQLALSGDWQLRVRPAKASSTRPTHPSPSQSGRTPTDMKKTLTLLAIAGSLVGVPAASAHVTVNPNEVAADSFSRFAIRVPNERPNAETTKIVVRLPRNMYFISLQPKPGWKRTVTMEKLDPPVELEGEMQTERVATVTWEGGKIAPGEFDEFGISAKVPDAPGQTLAFPANQTYSNGEVVRWIGAADSETPASRVTLGPKEARREHGHDRRAGVRNDRIDRVRWRRRLNH